MLHLAKAERGIDIVARLAGCIADPRNESRAVRGVVDILRAAIFAIACGYEDAISIIWVTIPTSSRL